MLPQDHKHLKDLYLGVMETVGRPPATLPLGTGTHRQMLGSWWARTGQSGQGKKGREQNKEGPVFSKEHV